MIPTRLDQSARIMLAYMVGGVMILAILAIGIKVSWRDKSPESKFTPEQKAVLSALRTARAEAEQTRAQLEKTKQEINDMLNGFRQAAIAKGVNPDVPTSWLDLHANGQPIVTAPNAQGQQVSVHWGFRDDGLVVWKRP